MGTGIKFGIGCTLLAALALVFAGCGGGGGGGSSGTPAGGGTPPATLSNGDTIVFTFNDGSGALNITITGGGTTLDYTITGASGPDNGTADVVWGPPSGSNVNFQTNNIVSAPFGPSGNNSWNMVFNTNTTGTASDTGASFGASTFVYTPGAGGGGAMAPAALAAGNVLSFDFVGGLTETYTMTSPTAFNFANSTGSTGTGTSTYTPAGATSTLGVNVTATGGNFADTFNMTWTSATGGTWNSGGGSGTFTFTP